MTEHEKYAQGVTKAGGYAAQGYFNDAKPAAGPAAAGECRAAAHRGARHSLGIIVVCWTLQSIQTSLRSAPAAVLAPACISWLHVHRAPTRVTLLSQGKASLVSPDPSHPSSPLPPPITPSSSKRPGGHAVPVQAGALEVQRVQRDVHQRGDPAGPCCGRQAQAAGGSGEQEAAWC